jgi:hypothetical protein
MMDKGEHLRFLSKFEAMKPDELAQRNPDGVLRMYCSQLPLLDESDWAMHYVKWRLLEIRC